MLEAEPISIDPRPYLERVKGAFHGGPDPHDALHAFADAAEAGQRRGLQDCVQGGFDVGICEVVKDARGLSAGFADAHGQAFGLHIARAEEEVRRDFVHPQFAALEADAHGLSGAEGDFMFAGRPYSIDCNAPLGNGDVQCQLPVLEAERAAREPELPDQVVEITL